ncbi:MAG: bifunctional oligoribonuclease/PAP phosphatase NrnA [Elusimicrobiaceae bacterium]|nr:bifunctional oligoribonuclease/PAP phosphatase NrnA [Elusimicrobiaceae bacterium]
MKNKFTKEVKQISKVLKTGKSFFIAVHKNPDPDTLGAGLAMAEYLKNKKKKVYLFSDDQLSDKFSFMPNIKKINVAKFPKTEKFDVIITFECSSKNRISDNKKNMDNVLKNAKHILNIDHHIVCERYGTVNYIDANISSVSEMVFGIFQHIKASITKSMATNLFTGISTDTNRFLYQNTSASTYEVAGKLKTLGADADKINTEMYQKRSLESTRIMARALTNLEILKNGKLAISQITKKDFKELKANNNHSEGVVNNFLMIPGVEVAVFLKEEAKEISANLRSKDKFDVSKVAVKFGGGGHKRASGFKSSHKKLADIKQKLIKEIKWTK